MTGRIRKIVPGSSQMSDVAFACLLAYAALVAVVTRWAGEYIAGGILDLSGLAAALIAVGLWICSMFLSLKDSGKMMKEIKGMREELNERNEKLDTMERLLVEIRDEAREMRKEMSGMRKALERLGGGPVSGDGAPSDPVKRRPTG